MIAAARFCWTMPIRAWVMGRLHRAAAHRDARAWLELPQTAGSSTIPGPGNQGGGTAPGWGTRTLAPNAANTVVTASVLASTLRSGA